MLYGKKVLMTGASGQIGEPLALELAKGNEVWALGRFGNAQTREGLEAAGVRIVAADLASGDFGELPRDFTHVLHLGTFRQGGLDYDRAVSVNAEGTHLLYRHCASAQAHLVMSTAEVYRPRPDPWHVYKESDPLGDSNSPYDATYSISKLAQEAVARSCARAYDAPTIIARMNAAYGVSPSGLLGKHLTAIMSDNPVVVKWDPAVYSPIHDIDIAAQLGPLMAAASVPTTILNWGGDETATAQEWCALMGELLGVKPTIEVRLVEGGIRGVRVDVSRRLALTGPCKVSWREGVTRLVAHHVALRDAAAAEVKHNG